MTESKCKGCEKTAYPRGAEWCRACRESMADYCKRLTETIAPARFPHMLAELMFEAYADQTVARLEKRLEALEERAVGVPVIGLHNALARGLTPGGTMPQNAEDPSDITSPARPPTTYTLPAEAVEELRATVLGLVARGVKGLMPVAQIIGAAKPMWSGLDAARPAE